MKSSRPGLFITFEGGEGVGKSSLITMVNEYLSGEQIAVIQTREPGGCNLGISIRKLLLESEALAKKAELLLFLANRAQHVEEVIRPALEKKQIVLCDRFSDSTKAYQGVARHLEPKMVSELCDFATGELTPDLTFLLDLDPLIGFERVTKARDGIDRIEQESLEFHQNVREGFLKIAKENQERIHVIDASLSIDDVFKQIITVLKPQLTSFYATP